MLFKPIPNYSKKRHAAFIYDVVFNSAFSAIVIFTLFASFFIQPIHQAYANENETDGETTEEVTPSANEVESQSDTPTEVEVSPPNEPDITEVSSETAESEVETVYDGEVNTETSPDQTGDLSETVYAEEVVNDDNDSAIDNIESDPIDETLTEEEEDVDDDIGEGVDDDIKEITVNSLESTTTLSSTTSSEVVDPAVPVQAQNLVTEDNYYQFSKQSCVAIGDGTFHCSLSSETGIDLNAVVYAELGKNKNMEIFLRTSSGEVKQLTDNFYDDTSPNYNAESMQVVWQRQVDDRYQVVMYDIASDEESQLTFSRTNNMEPKVSEEGIVWQAWDGNDWEIMYFDGKYTDQLTDNLTQDVAPAIDDGYILWSVLGESEQEAKVYSLASGEILNINGYEGGVITNPRFVLVYDTVFDNGDVITQGFDPVTGLSSPIAAKPAEDPVNIPDADPTGETRALIQSKTSEKAGFNADGTKNPTGTTTPNISANSSSTTQISDSLNLRTAGDSPTTTEMDPNQNTPASSTEAAESFELTDYDLILLPIQNNQTEETEVSTTTLRN